MHHRLGARAHPHLVENVGQMSLHRANAYGKPLCNLAIRHPFGSHPEDLQLPLGELIQGGMDDTGLLLRLGEAVDHLAGNGRVEHRLPCIDSLYGLDQFINLHVLEQVAGSPSLQEGEDVLVAIVGGQYQNGDAGGNSLDLPRGLNTIKLWHREVHHNDVWTLFDRPLNGLLPIAGLGDDINALLAVQQLPSTLTNHGVVIGQ